MTLDLPIIPHGNTLLVAPADEPRAVWTPEAARPPQRAVVLAVGAGLANETGHTPSPPCEVGALIVHKRHAGTDLRWNGHRIPLMAFDDVLGVLSDDS